MIAIEQKRMDKKGYESLQQYLQQLQQTHTHTHHTTASLSVHVN